MSTAAVIARIATQYSDKGSKAAQKDIARLTKKFEAFGKKAQKSFKLAIVATAALSVKIGKDAVQAAIEDQKSQVILAQAMMNTTGATREAIDAAEAYIEKTMFRVNVADEQLRASLAQLYVATGDLTEAERLQGLALDVAAAKTLDLQAVTNAITKAQQGNVGVLKKLNPEIAALIGKTTKAEEVFAILGLTYGGTAEALADLDPLKKLSLAYGEVLETLGTELLPIVKLFAEYIVSDVIPAIDEWIKANGDQLEKALSGALKLFIGMIDLFADLAAFYDQFDWLIKIGLSFLAVGKAFKGVAMFGDDVVKVFSKFKGGFGGITASVEKFIGQLIFTKGPLKQILNLLYKGIQIVSNFAAAFLSVGTFIIIARNALEGLFDIKFPKFPWEKSSKSTSEKMDEISKKASKFASMDQAYDKVKIENAKTLQKIKDKATKQAEIDAANDAFDAAKAAKEKAEERAEYVKMIAVKKQLVAAGINPRTKAESTDLKAALLLLKKKGKAASQYEKERIAAQIKIKANGIIARDNKDPIDLEAARLLLLKQKDNEASLKKLSVLLNQIIAQDGLNKSTQKYADILAAIADDKLSDNEIVLLAKKWGLSVEAAKTYIYTVFAIKDNKVSDAEVQVLAQAWGISTRQAGMYLDFIAKLRDDGKISDADIQTLMSSWGLSKAEAEKYKDVILKIENDGDISDEDIRALARQWGVSNKEVLDYLNKIKAPATYSGTLFDAADIAFNKWRKANNELDAYLAKLAKGVSAVVPEYVPPVVITPKVTDPGSSTDSDAVANAAKAAAAANASASKAAADAYAAAKAKGDMAAAAIAAAGVTPSALAAGESGAIGAASIAAQLRAAEAARAAADAAAKQASSLAAFKAKEAADLAASQAAASTMDYDERFRIRAAQGVMSATAGTPSSAGVVVNLTVQGSVTTEQDLVQTVRNGLLRSQYNGQGLALATV
jgi:hypothetical protein